MRNDQETGSPTWNDAMYSKHPTPYGKSLAGFIQAKRVSRVIKYADIGSKDRVLEIGCESGKLCAAIPDCGRLVGCDISMQALEDARKLLLQNGKTAEFLFADALHPLPFQQGEFDVIICSEMLEHVTDPRTVISHIAEVCTVKTRVVLTVPIEAPKVRLKQLLQKLGILSFLFPGIERGQSEWHLQAFSKRYLLQLTSPDFVCRKSSSVLGCHFVALLQLKSSNGVGSGKAGGLRDASREPRSNSY
jgi:SAM-dependent methyltransferase